MKKIYSKIKEKYYRFDAEVNTDGNSSFRKKVKYAYSKEGKKKLFKFTGKFYNKYLGKTSNRNKKSNNIDSSSYRKWRVQNTPSKADYHKLEETLKLFNYQPKISIIMEINNANNSHLKKSINSITNQVYQNWELIICGNPNQEALELSKKDNRIKLRLDQDINSIVEKSEGEYISYLSNENQLAPEALYEIIAKINNNRNIDFLYSDDDHFNEKEKLSNPKFKPDWCPDNLLSRNYISQILAIKKSLYESIGGFNEEYGNEKEYDLLLRVAENTNLISHIPKILLHKRINNSADPTIEKKIIEAALKRRNINASVIPSKKSSGYYRIKYHIQQNPKVSIVIPTKDKTSILKQCVDSIFKKTTYTNYEIILVDNGSTETEFFDYIELCQKREPNRFKNLTYNIPFNFSKLVNYGVKNSTGSLVLLLNNDTEVISPDWIESMIEQAQRNSIGVVGAQLIFPNDTIQHCGVVLGMEGTSGHSFIGYKKDAPGYSNLIQSTNNVTALTGACIMIRKDLYNEVGGFDEEFAVEFNDIDFCLKIKEKGFNNIYLPHVKLYHYESLSRGNQVSSTRLRKEINLVKQRWGKYIDHDPCYNPNLSLEYTDYRLP